MNRRTLIISGVVAPGALVSDEATAQTGHRTQTFVLVHGAWHGGWCWRFVADALRLLGHKVFTPTLTGLGERRRLLSGEIVLDTHITDIANVIEMEDLQDIVLVGHSYAGIVISGVADRLPERIRHMVYLDSLLMENGQSALSVLPPGEAAARRKLVADQGLGIAFPVPSVSAFGIPDDHPEAPWVRRHLTPHPVGTYETPLVLEHALGAGKPTTYIHCTNPPYAPLAPSRQLARRQPGWSWKEIATGHDAMVTAPAQLARMFDQIS